MIELVESRRGVYRDSVTLMQLTQEVGRLPGIEAAIIAAGTELNVALLVDLGFASAAVADVSGLELLVAIRTENQRDMDTAIALVESGLNESTTSRASDSAVSEPRSTGATVLQSGADLALVSVPGPYAFVEAMDAIRSGANVMIFSDGVSIAEEVALKAAAAAADRLVMGPDCGTAMIAGLGVGFANEIRAGSVSLIAASGTGAQQVATLLDGAGIGLRHIIGVGSRDLSDAVGAASTLRALSALEADPGTDLIVLISKPTAETARRTVRRRVSSSTTPVIVGIVGDGHDDLTAVVGQVAAQVGVSFPEPPIWGTPPQPGELSGGALRGLFTGGTLAQEAAAIARPGLGEVHGLPALGYRPTPATIGATPGHVIVDMGDERFTEGRAHPMIDQALRLETIGQTARHLDRGVILIDVVLGHGAHPDPASDLAPRLAEIARTAADSVRVVVSIIGSRKDPQGLEQQAEMLVDSGAVVFASNAAATRSSVAALIGTGPQP